MNSCSYINIFLRTAPSKKIVKNLEFIKNLEFVKNLEFIKNLEFVKNLEHVLKLNLVLYNWGRTCAFKLINGVSNGQCPKRKFKP